MLWSSVLGVNDFKGFHTKFDLPARSLLAFILKKVSKSGTLKVITTERPQFTSTKCRNALLRNEYARRARVNVESNK